MQPQYRAFTHHVSQRSPHAPNQRRGGIGKSNSAQSRKALPDVLNTDFLAGPMMAPGPQPSVPLSQAQISQQQQVHAQANEMAKRRSRKPTDKNMPDGVDNCVIDQEAVQRYRELRNIERWLDATTTRKRLGISECVGRSRINLSRVLRIWISNTVEDQAWQGNGLNVDAFDFTTNMEASYRVKIQGRLLEERDDDAGGATEDHEARHLSPMQSISGNMDNGDRRNSTLRARITIDQRAQHASDSRRRLSHFFKALSIDFDRSRFRNGAEQKIEWKRPETSLKPQTGVGLPVAADFDELTFKRNGDENMNITINLYRHEIPDRFQLSPELAEVIDMSEATQQDAVMGLWEYIRFWGLQESEEKRNFRCDELLKRVIGRGDVGYVPMLNEYVAQHLRPLPPISLPYTIRVDEDFHRNPHPTVYDVRVSVDDPVRAELLPLINSPQNATFLKEVAAFDEELARLIQAIAVSKTKHSFLTSLGENPVAFVRNWLSSQARDLEIIVGETSRQGGETVKGDEWRKGGLDSVWATQNARESVNVLLARQR